ncbi:TRAP transporter solute receptor, unknown substrate 3 [Marinobacterium lacunae]|uniref:TRAP-type C4-dicarboxylate transport system, periplasmic component n=1 Tax=Marinobacterium lacunae TaxID=1232683 RepID=A0A081FVY3_9GAMM|nr:TRAP transporter substrate-binding protein [Marinobacterium lacunae]KEA62688.1 TRAP transporter solute receptor, unknown substrate 3 [Marinobacterium lacunae]MBR9884456.1 TRAP transporter substrate-binding protein [Oceanospirillales bacterium]
MYKKNRFISLMAAAGLSFTATVNAAEVDLRFAHFWPANSGIAKTLASWGEAVEAESNGRINVEIYPSQTLAKATQTYDSVVRGIADVGAIIQGYTANRFPLSQIVELPGIVHTGEQGSCVLQKLYDEGDLDSEYQDAHVLFMFTHGPGHIHTKGKPVTKPEDLAGLMIRRPTVVVGDLLEGLGGEPVGLPAPDMYSAMQRGTINGVTLPWEAMASFRLNELADQHTQVGLYSLAFVVTMNKDTYAGMPEDLKKVIDDNTGMRWAEKLGKAYDELDLVGVQQAKEMGHTINVVENGAENPAWKPTLQRVSEQYISGLDQQGLPAAKVYERAQTLSSACGA